MKGPCRRTESANELRTIAVKKNHATALDTITLLVRDTEHEFITIITALQAHIDLMQMEQSRNKLVTDRIAVLNRATARILKNTTALLAVSEEAQAPQSRRKVRLQMLMDEITADTILAFQKSKVALSCDIAAGTILAGRTSPVKLMIKSVVLAVLDKCHERETVQVVALKQKNRISLSVDTGSGADNGTFKPWNLGKLRLMPTNGEGIALAAVDAMARLHHGSLRVATRPDQRHRYKLVFQSASRGI